MTHFITTKNSDRIDGAARRPGARFSTIFRGLLAIALCCPNGTVAYAITRTLPSHGKTTLDSYNYLLRDTHPASQAQANYLQNLLIMHGVKKVKRLERQERLDVYAERQLIKKLQYYSSVVKRLSAGRPMKAESMASFWALVSVFGDTTEVYEALSSDVPQMPHGEFVATSGFIRIVQPSGALEPPPLLLEAAEGVDAAKFQAAWNSMIESLQWSGRLSASGVVDFRKCVADYRLQCADAISRTPAGGGRMEADKYLRSLDSLANAIYRPQQCAHIRTYIEQGGYAYGGNNMLGLIQHMLQNRVTPVQGSTAQLALAEVARPISRVLEQEIALHYERIDSMATGEGHRPYAAEYRQRFDPVSATPGVEVSRAAPAGNAGS